MITKQMFLDAYFAMLKNNHTGTMSCFLDFIKNIPGEPEFDIHPTKVKPKSEGFINKVLSVKNEEAVILKDTNK